MCGTHWKKRRLRTQSDEDFFKEGGDVGVALDGSGATDQNC